VGAASKGEMEKRKKSLFRIVCFFEIGKSKRSILKELVGVKGTILSKADRNSLEGLSIKCRRILLGDGK